MAQVLIPPEEKPVSLPECESLVERLACSVELRRAARLRAFLVYVCEQALHQDGAGLHEQEIGAAVFGRPPGYDTSIDNIVRVNATELRKRLEHYFAEEGAAEEIILEIQRGNYAPVFRRRSLVEGRVERRAANLTPEATSLPQPSAPATAAPQDEPAPEQDLHPAPEKPTGKRRLVLWQAACATLLIACLALAWQNRQLTVQSQPWKRSPALRALWSNFFDSSNEADLLLADTSFTLAEDMMQRTISLTDYLNYNYKQFAESPSLPEATRRDLRMVLERNNGSIADFRVGQQILALDPGRLTLSFAREFTPDAAKHNSLVIVGARQSNPWEGLFAGKLNFDIEYDPATERPWVVNHAPRPGEFATYPNAASHDTPGTSYAVIAYLPDLSGKGRVLLVEGCDSQATGAAGDFVTNEDSLALLEQKFPSQPLPYFEVLLRTVQLSGTPMRGEVIAYRTYPAKP
jgi:hypothetical protein